MAAKEAKLQSINNYFLKIFIPIVLLVSVTISALSAWHDYEVNKSSRLESQKLIYQTFAATIQQPLIQGSLIEVKIRANELTRNKQVPCVEVKTTNEFVVNCEKDLSKNKGLNKITSTLYFGNESGQALAELTVFFDNSDLISGIWKKISENVGAFILLSTILFITFSIGFSRIKIELDELIKIARNSNEKNTSSSKFKIKEFASIGKNLLHQFEISKSAAESKASVEVAKKVAHDIRSPLAVLSGLTQALSEITPADKKILLSSLDRIKSIIQDLDYKKVSSSKSTESVTKQGLRPLLEELIQEKRVNNQHINFTLRASDETAYCFSTIPQAEFQRTISNLIDNSIEAITGDGSIEITLELKDNKNIVIIKDTGKGISQDKLPLVTKKGFSFGKTEGSGLGLYYAKKLMEDYSGSILIKSGAGQGTQVTLSIPVANQPAWVPPEIPLTTFKRIAIIDDKEINFWTIKQSLGDKLENIEVKTFKSCEEFNLSQKDNFLNYDWHFVDYDFGKNKITGLDFIVDNGLQEKSTLVTGHFDALIEESLFKNLEIKVSPKDLAGINFT